MKLVFTSSRQHSPSFTFYRDSLLKINGAIESVFIEVKNDPTVVDYSAYDVALFMGYDQQAAYAKTVNPTIITGVFDPRAAQGDAYGKVDFIAANDIVSKDYFSEFTDNIIVYYTYPMVPPRLPCPLGKARLVLGYHGNPVHLEAMYPRITQAIAALAKELPTELWAMYNIEKHGKWQRPTRQDLGFPVIHIQHSDENYARYLANVDIGLVPQFVVPQTRKKLWLLIDRLDSKSKMNPSLYTLQFKETTNIGRHLIFAQYHIPIVSDMSPSTCAFIEDEQDGFVAFRSSGWYRALKKLAVDSELRMIMGERLHAKFQEKCTHEKLNDELISFLQKMVLGSPGIIG